MYRNNKLFARETATSKDSNRGQPQSSQNDEDEMMNIIFGDATTSSSCNTEADNPHEPSMTQKRKARVLDDITKCVKHLNKRGINTPSNFAQILSEERAVYFSASPNTVPLSTIDAIIRACELWKPYITPESFHNLVCEQVKSMYRIKASAICYTNSGAELQAYIGNFATLTELPPLGFSCSVNYYGTVVVNGV